MHLNWRLTLLASALMVLISCKKNKSSGLLLPGGDSDTLVVQPPEMDLYVQQARFTAIGSNVGGFYEALPPKYNPDSSKKYPLLVFLHGGGELGDGTTQLPLIDHTAIKRLLDKKRFPDSFKVNGEDYSFVIICPQFKIWPKVQDVNQVINFARENYNIDTNRIYLSGMSMGGGATWEYAAEYGGQLAAIVPICGASWAKESTAKEIAATNVPTWAFHNKDDSIVTVRSTTRYLDFIKEANPLFPAKLTLWESGGHDAWTRSTDPDYKEDGKNIYEWMLQFKR